MIIVNTPAKISDLPRPDPARYRWEATAPGRRSCGHLHISALGALVCRDTYGFVQVERLDITRSL